MPSGGGGLTPSNLEAGIISPSPARDALNRNPDSSLTLNRKKSWFGSVRETLSRGAIHAKGYVDTLRGGEEGQGRSKAEHEESGDRSKDILDEEASIGQSASNSDGDSITPLRPGRSGRQHTFTPKSAMSSLRQHIHTSRDRRALGALLDITVNVQNEAQSSLIGPEAMCNAEPDSADTAKGVAVPLKGHAKKNSIGRSLVGSIRSSIGRKGVGSKVTSPVKAAFDDNSSPTKRAAAVPLPSSPINIPAPTLGQLDLGPSALMSTTFGRSPELEHRSELLAMTDPSHQVAARVPTYYTRIPGEGPDDRPLSPIRRKSPLTPGELLELPVDDFGFSIPTGPSTPMPGTNATLDLDGTNDDATLVFERSVESKDKSGKQENRQLKKMASIDAMAAPQSPGTPQQAKVDSTNCLNSFSDGKKRNLSAASTVVDCPEYMLPLSRQQNTHSQLAALQTASTGHRNSATGEWKSEDPFAPGNATGDIAMSGPPSPDRLVKLPLRPKIRIQSVDATEPRTWEPETMSKSGDIEITYARDIASMNLEKRNVSDAPTTWAVCMPWSEFETQKENSAMHSGELQNKMDRATAPPPSRKESSDYEQFKTHHIFGDLTVETPLPDYDSIDDEPPPHVSSASSSGRNTVAPIYQRISASQTPSPGRTRAGTTHSADVGDVFWKFHVNHWIEDAEQDQAGTPDAHPSPCRPSDTASITSVSATGERSSPQVSPPVSSHNRTPSMGDRLNFDKRRSERNMRYNALSDMTGTSSPEPEDGASSPKFTASLSPALKLIINDNSSETRELSLANFDAAYQHAALILPSEDDLPLDRHRRIEPSSEDIEEMLQQAIADNYTFQIAMAGIGADVSPSFDSTAAEQIPSPFDSFHEHDEAKALAAPFSSSGTSAADARNSSSPMDFSPSTNDERRDSLSEILRERGVVNDYNFEVAATSRAEEDTLDEALDMFSRYNESKDRLQDGQFPSDDDVDPKGRRDSVLAVAEEVLSSPDSGYKADENSGTPSKPELLRKPLPGRYRSRRGRHV